MYSLYFIQLTEETVFDVMCKADMYLLPGLKKLCAVYIGELIDEENVFTVFEMSRLFNLPKLEDQCAAFIADNLEQVYMYTEVAQLGIVCSVKQMYTGAVNSNNELKLLKELQIEQERKLLQRNLSEQNHGGS